MSITVVQTAHATGGSNATACSFASLPTAGNTILVCAWGRGLSSASFTPTCADNQSNSYSSDVHAVTNGNYSHILRASNIGTPSGTFTVTYTDANFGSSPSVVLLEVSGLDNTGQPEVTPVSASNSSGSTVAPGNMTTTNAADLVLAAMNDNGTISASPSSPWTSAFKIASTANEVGEAVYQIVSSTGTFNPSWTVSGFDWTACQAAYKAGSGGGSSGKAAQKFRWTSKKPSASSLILPSTGLTKRIQACFAFNDGSGNTVTEYKNHNNGTTTNSPTWSIGITGPCLNFTAASNQKLSFSPVSLGTCTTTMAWVKLANTTNNQMICSTSTTDYGTMLALLPTDASSRNIYCSDGGSIENYVAYSNWDTDWHHYAIVRVDSNYSFYVDGQLVGTSNRGGTNVASAPDQIGLYHNYTTFNLGGALDSVLLFDRALSAAEVAAYALDPYIYADFPDEDFPWLNSVSSTAQIWPYLDTEMCGGMVGMGMGGM